MACVTDGKKENLRNSINDSLLSTAYCQLPTAYCQLPTASCQLPAAYCQLPTVNCQLPTVNCLLPTAYCQLPTANCLLSTVNCLLSTAYCLLSTAYCLLPTACCLLSTVNCLLKKMRQYWVKNYTLSEIKFVLDKNHGIVYSVRQIQRLLKKFGLKKRGKESPHDEIIAAIQQELAGGSGIGVGIRPMQYKLQRKYNLIVSRQTVNDILKILTPAALSARRTGRLVRRVYSVQGPNHIWHCDGYDKLKQFGFCVHGAIDGWSRKLIWLRVNRTNNDPNVICTYYMESVRELGFIPRSLRIDAGTENVAMADVHQLLRQEHNDEHARNFVITGRSVHNERIERFWSYLGMAYTKSLLDLFKDMRDSGILDTSNVLHTECLRFCFTPVITSNLQLVMNTWNDHRIRKQTNQCIVGRPSFLYDFPEEFDGRDQSVPVDCNSLAACEEIFSVHVPEMGASDEFSELALELMLLHNLQLPTSLHDALDLFDSLCELMV